MEFNVAKFGTFDQETVPHKLVPITTSTTNNKNTSF